MGSSGRSGRGSGGGNSGKSPADKWFSRYDDGWRPARLPADLDWSRLVRRFKLTAQQTRVLARVCDGLAFDAIAHQMDRSTHNVEYLWRAVKKKLDADSHVTVLHRVYEFYLEGRAEHDKRTSTSTQRKAF